MDFTRLVGNAADPGAFLKQELEEGLEPITKRVDALEKKLDLLLMTAGRIEALLTNMKPVVDLIKKLPFVK